MFVFQFKDGKYMKNLGKAGTCPNKSHVDYWKEHSTGTIVESALKYLEECKTSDINEAELFLSVQSVRSSNCYKWGGSIYEVKVKVEIDKCLS